MEPPSGTDACPFCGRPLPETPRFCRDCGWDGEVPDDPEEDAYVRTLLAAEVPEDAPATPEADRPSTSGAVIQAAGGVAAAILGGVLYAQGSTVAGALLLVGGLAVALRPLVARRAGSEPVPGTSSPDRRE